MEKNTFRKYLMSHEKVRFIFQLILCSVEVKCIIRSLERWIKTLHLPKYIILGDLVDACSNSL
jgi:hypothetical protein